VETASDFKEVKPILKCDIFWNLTEPSEHRMRRKHARVELVSGTVLYAGFFGTKYSLIKHLLSEYNYDRREIKQILVIGIDDFTSEYSDFDIFEASDEMIEVLALGV
jgi:hypothetical protein